MNKIVKNPNEWRYVKINEIGTVKTGPFGAQLHQSDYVALNGTPIVTVEHLCERGLIHKNLPLVSNKDRKRLSQYKIEEGDIVFSRVGSVDRSSVISKKESGWLFSGRLLRIRPQKQDVFSPFLIHFFHTEKFKHRMRSVAVGGTMPSLNTQILSNEIILLPPLPEQKAIADLLSTWDEAIEKTERLIQARERRFKWLLRILMNPNDECQMMNAEIEGNHNSALITHNSPKALAKGGWKKVKLGEVCKIQIGRTPSRKKTEYWDIEKLSGNYWLSISDLSLNREIVSSKEQVSNQAITECNMNLIPAGTIIMSFKLTLGKTCKLKKAAYTNEAIASFLNLSKDIYDDYLFHYLPAVNWDSLVDQAAKGKTLNKEKLNNYKFLLPPLEQQKQIAEILSTAQKEIDLLKQLSEKYKTQKRGLMQKMLTGIWRMAPDAVMRYEL